MHKLNGLLRLGMLCAAPALVSATLATDDGKVQGSRSTLQFIAIGGIVCIGLDRLMRLRKKG